MNKIPTTPLPADGSRLETETAALLRLVPGARVTEQALVKGKKVDVVIKLVGHIAAEQTIAIECKDWERPLTRRQAAEIQSEYLPLFADNTIDQFWLVTRNGLVPNAKEIFNERTMLHLTIPDLMRKLLNPLPLIQNMVAQFQVDSLAETYIPLRATAPDLLLAHRKYELFYNDFIEFALSEHLDFDSAMMMWKKYAANDLLDPEALYTPALFAEVARQRRKPADVDLEEYVYHWLNNPEVNTGLALLGSYGTGKSCFARRIAASVADGYLHSGGSRVPFLIELKDFGAHQDIRGLITHELVNRHGVLNGSFELFRALNRSGFFFIILDGFDEMKQGMTTDSLLFNFHQIGTLLEGQAKVLLCGRPTLFENQSEQNRVLQGLLSQSQASPARFIHLTVQPFEVEEACRYLLHRSAGSTLEERRRMFVFVKELKIEAAYNDELRQLICRPVHLPMLAVVVPRTRVRPSELRRAILYREFITDLIQREMLKRRHEFQASYSSEARFRFAKQLCVEIAKRGESRSIRYSEVPDEFLAPFVRPSVPLHAVRRDLVAACFLERKPPDILYIPHKSFLEFLVADYILEEVRVPEPRTDTLGPLLSLEVFAFLREMTNEEDWMRVFDYASANTALLGRFTQQILGSKLDVSPRLESSWQNVFFTFAPSLREAIVFYYESVAAELSSNGKAVLQMALTDKSYVAAVHAYRALNRFKQVPSIKDTIRRIGGCALEVWIESKWVSWSGDEVSLIKLSAARERLIGVLRSDAVLFGSSKRAPAAPEASNST